MEQQSHKKDAFLAAVHKFMEMGTLTAPLLQELIDHIDVYETEGTGKSRTQRIVIYYRFVGYIELPAVPLPETTAIVRTPARAWRWSISPSSHKKNAGQ